MTFLQHACRIGAPIRVVDPDWRRVSAQMTAYAKTVSTVPGVTVVAAPTAGQGAPGCCDTESLVIELHAPTCFDGIDPATINATDTRDHTRYPVAIGVLHHEIAHAQHTRWDRDPKRPGLHTRAAMTLEELRIEHLRVLTRPVDRPWLKAAVEAINLAGFPPASDVMRQGWWRAASLAAVTLGRIDAGTLESSEVPIGLHRSLRAALGRSLLERLRRIWRQALHIADTDAVGMYRLARRWCRLITRQAPPSPDQLELILQAIADAEAILEGLSGDKSMQSTEPPLGQHPPLDRLFTRRSRYPTRPPTTGEHNAAKTLARNLRELQTTQREATIQASATPPGRLKMRGALAGSAQRAAGAPVTAQPWRTQIRRRPPSALPTIGVALDVSTSMEKFFGPAASAAWICSIAAEAAHGQSAAATFGSTLTPLVAVTGTLDGVPVPEGEFATGHLACAITALDRALHLGDASGGARLLVMITDGWLNTHVDLDEAVACINSLRQRDCAVVQIAPPNSHELHGADQITLTDPTLTIQQIARAITTAMRRAQQP